MICAYVLQHFLAEFSGPGGSGELASEIEHGSD